MKHTASPGTDRYTVQVVDRGLDLLELLRDAPTPLSLGEIARRLGVAKTTGFRLLRTLERRGYVERLPGDHRYRLGPEWVAYVGRLPGPPSLAEAALPYLRRLRDRFAETVNLGVLRQGEVLYVEILESPHPFRMAAAVGARSPVHSTALGKAIAAHLPDEEVEAIVRQRGLPALTSRTITSLAAFRRELEKTRLRGFAEDNGETEPEASCVAAPVFGFGGQVVAAVSISGPTSRIQAIRPRAVRALRVACAAISRELGFTRMRSKARGAAPTVFTGGGRR
ncbi:MAG: IclR family transcriptional regulator [Armatimonadota bacterium]|nr:IclR family transcriptional regulator [Armatimonadota bacterium]